MTISTTSNKAILNGDGLNTSFNFSFAVRSSADLLLSYTDASGNVTVLSSSLYSVSLNPIPAGALWPAGGSVVYPLSGSAIVSGTKLTIQRNVPYQQNSSLINQGGYYPQTVEQALDVETMEIQQLAEQLSRAIVADPTDSSPVMQLPSALQRANGALGFDASGNVVILNQSTGTPTFGNSVFVVNSIAALRAFAVPSGVIAVCVLGYSAPGDGGGGFYVWSASSAATDDGGITIALNAGGTGRFIKLFGG